MLRLQASRELPCKNPSVQNRRDETRNFSYGGESSYTVAGVVLKQSTKKLSPGRLAIIKNNTWREHAVVMDKMSTADFNEIVNAKCRGLRLRTRNSRMKMKASTEELSRRLEYEGPSTVLS